MQTRTVRGSYIVASTKKGGGGGGRRADTFVARTIVTGFAYSPKTSSLVDGDTWPVIREGVGMRTKRLLLVGAGR